MDNFAAWLRKVDQFVGATLGVGIHDLPDYCWRDLFDDGLDPVEAAEDFVAECLDGY